MKEKENSTRRTDCGSTPSGPRAGTCRCRSSTSHAAVVTLDGAYQDTLAGFGLPANIDTHGDLMVVPELFARVSMLNRNNEVVARLGDDSERIRSDSSFAIRGDEKQWKPGLFVHPHDACFDADGNIFVAEWVATGRVTKLRRLG